MAVVVMFVAAASAHAESGGISTGKGHGHGQGGVKGGSGGKADVESPEPGECATDPDLGARELSEGDCGADVETLNQILNSKEFGLAAPLGADFDSSTAEAVKSLQEVADLQQTGIVDEDTQDALVTSMRPDTASFFGPGFYGNEMACGERLTRTTIGVAHRTLPCGTKVTIKYRGHYLNTEVVDRGPYTKGVKWDLTSAAAQQVGLEVTSKVRSAIVR